jgi:hypothetical protein
MYIISKELAQQIIDYLAKRPYYEVYTLIPQLQLMHPLEGKVDEHNGELATSS